ncbi:DJ-1/PfpI family protein, partial [Pseudescherichia sp.]|uniref:DJ-1/PfpI family protein n=1 Tax=Pseudescherichia sp. TaxID=2055881 RepID=UPI0028A91C6D
MVAGGLLEETREPPAWLLQALRDLHARAIPIVTLCSGAFVAGSAGLLDGRHCAIHFTTRDEFKMRFPKALPVIDKTYIKDGGIISCPGGTAIDLAADLIRHHCGLVRAQKVLKYLLVDDTAVSSAKAKQKESLSQPDGYENELVSKVIAFMQHHLDSPVPLADVAEFAGVTFR